MKTSDTRTAEIQELADAIVNTVRAGRMPGAPRGADQYMSPTALHDKCGLSPLRIGRFGMHHLAELRVALPAGYQVEYTRSRYSSCFEVQAPPDDIFQQIRSYQRAHLAELLQPGAQLMPHEVANRCGLRADQAAEVLLALTAAGRGTLTLLIYHSCQEVPVASRPIAQIVWQPGAKDNGANNLLEEARRAFPAGATCPECEEEVIVDGLRFDTLFRIPEANTTP